MSIQRIQKIASLDRHNDVYVYNDGKELAPLLKNGELFYVLRSSGWYPVTVMGSTWKTGKLFTTLPNPLGKHANRDYTVSSNNVYSMWDYDLIDLAKKHHLAFSKSDMVAMNKLRAAKIEASRAETIANVVRIANESADKVIEGILNTPIKKL